jgi:alkanesulfonate monooxygenase SsuD/methylene tetrahydromethanopterin reductase-like flavin-dependent oxidoreductase (luciferase family)
MEVGICLPYMERNFGRKAILDWCHRVDSGPWSSMSCGERITGYTLEMRAMLAAAAAVTERVRIMPSLYVLPMHSSVWAAKEVATLDVLSEGRVTLCVGVGGREIDYRAVGASFARRHARLDEQIATMRRIWIGEAPIDGADEVGPRPVQPGGPPILAGAMGPKSIARAAHWADGIYAFSMGGNADEIRRTFDLADTAWMNAGRTVPPRKVGGFWFSLTDDAERSLKDYVHNYLAVFGDAPARAIARTMTRFEPTAVRESIEAMQEAGCDEIILSPCTADPEEVERAARLIG